MILRSALQGVTPIHGGARLISTMSTPLLSTLEQQQHSFVRDTQGLLYPRGRKLTPEESKAKMAKMNRAKSLEKYQTRQWREGDIYSPHDLSPAEMKKWTQPKGKTEDVFDILGINPIHEYKNYSIMWEFMSSMGRIKHRAETGLRRVNQRRIAKAIRRAVAMGLIPSVHKHPEMLEADARVQRNELARTMGWRYLQEPVGTEGRRNASKE